VHYRIDKIARAIIIFISSSISDNVRLRDARYLRYLMK